MANEMIHAYRKMYPLFVAVLAGAIFFVATGNTKITTLFMNPPAHSYQATAAVYDGLIKTERGILTKYPAERNLYVRLIGPDYLVENTAGIYSVEITQQGPTGISFPPGIYMATAGESKIIEIVPLMGCENKQSFPLSSCHVIFDPSEDLEFLWNIDADTAGKASLRIKFQKGLFLVDSRRGRSAVNFTLRDKSLTFDPNETRRVQIEDASFDISKGLMIIPIEIKTPLHLSQAQDMLVRWTGSILTALVSAGFIGWVFGNRRSGR